MGEIIASAATLPDSGAAKSLIHIHVAGQITSRFRPWQSFDQFLAVLSEVPDPRRAEGKIYKLPYVLLFSILAVVTGGNSSASNLKTFIKVHRRRLNTAFGLRWQRAPAHTAIR